LLLDTHIVLALLQQGDAPLSANTLSLLSDPASALRGSVATLWEIAIKHRLGKLRLTFPLDALPRLLKELGAEIVEINERHALAEVFPEPPTRDPFDRLLLAQCQVDGFRLVTFDRALAGHPLAGAPH
jgi:PIN domain nuclease of toxin-antitoxin system